MDRGSGILLHITSLPSDYGVGDFGPSAYNFVDFLARNGQKYWQILPLNPTSTRAFNSPYSSSSAFALNPLFISLDLLAEQHLIEPADLPSPLKHDKQRVDYEGAQNIKKDLIDKAFNNFCSHPPPDFKSFGYDHRGWLDDFCLFTIVKSHICTSPWNSWPVDLKKRKQETLDQLKDEYRMALLKEKFIQYILYRQWKNLKNYCHQKNVTIIGDMPIYLSQDSAEVWANPEMFKLDQQGRPLSVSGVPPDYFCAEGQLWGNPVYNWKQLQHDGYSWWLGRLIHNFKLFDLTRIDHFRGLVAYWEIPAGEENAINGKWVRVPVYDLFDHLLGRMKTLPIIAEDLGHITDDVKEVLSHYQFPTMKVLMFAFGQDNHPYLPHNYDRHCLVYTGTHDNNTAIGWYLNEAGAQERKRLAKYTGRQITAGNVHIELTRLAMQSVADICIIPMQDILGLDGCARMNLPATVGNNWQWSLDPDYSQDTKSSDMLADFTRIYGRL